MNNFVSFLDTLPRLSQKMVLLGYHAADNDGVASAALAEYALRLMRLGYECKGFRDLTVDALRDIANSACKQIIFLDIGSDNLCEISTNLRDKESVFVLDHHSVGGNPRPASNLYHCNPFIFGYDVHREATGASISYHFFKSQMPTTLGKDELRWAAQFVATAIISDRQRFPFNFEVAEKETGVSREDFSLLLRSSPHYLLGKLTNLIGYAIYGLNFDAVMDGVRAGVLSPRVGPNFVATTSTSLENRILKEDRLSRNLARMIPSKGSYPARVGESRSLLCEWLCGKYGSWSNGCIDLRRRRCPDLRPYYDLKHDDQAKILAGLAELRLGDSKFIFELLVPHLILVQHPIFGWKEAGSVAHICTALIKQGEHELARRAYLGQADKETVHRIHIEYNKELWRLLSALMS